MTEIRLKVTDDMSKMEEIGILVKLTRVFNYHPTNYLTSLFTSNFLNWTTEQINSDFPIDAYDYIRSTFGVNPELAEARTEVEKLKTEITVRTKALWETIEDREKSARVNDSLTEALTEEREKVDQLEIEAAMNQYAIAVKEQEISTLKASLFDFLNEKRVNPI